MVGVRVGVPVWVRVGVSVGVGVLVLVGVWLAVKVAVGVVIWLTSCIRTTQPPVPSERASIVMVEPLKSAPLAPNS